MAKQVKPAPAKNTSKKRIEQDENLPLRSPMTNLFFAALLGLIYLAVFDQTVGQSLIYAIGAFLFFNTIDYLILYYRLKKKEK